MPVKNVLLLTLAIGAAAMAQPYEGLVGTSGRVQVNRNGRPAFSISTGAFADGWRGASLTPAKVGETTDGVCLGKISLPDKLTIASALRATAAGKAMELRYTLTPKADAKLNSLHVSFGLPASFLKGASYTIEGETKEVPAVLGATHLRAGDHVPSVRFTWPNGDWLQVDILSKTPVLFQDNRQWGDSFDLRLGPQMVPAQTLPANQPVEIAMRVSAKDGMKLDFDRPVTITAGKDWVPLDLELDIEPGSALDFSGLGQFDAPSGKHGWLQATPDGKFAFADSLDTPRRFYGVNLCFTAQYLSHDEAERLAERFLRLGYNTVRFHHHEYPLIDRKNGCSTDLKPESIDQLDYLFAQFKKRGIYVTTDCYVSRPVYASEIWDGAKGNVEMNEFKMLVPVNERAFENWKTYNRNFLTHRNPYTGMRYADDPTLAWLSMINEANFGNYIRSVSDRARPDWERAWGAWLKARYGSAEAITKAWGSTFDGDLSKPTAKLAKSFTDDNRQSRDFAVFLADTERTMFLKMKKFLREEIGTKAMLTNMNGWTNTPQSQLARAEFDYVDDHFYVDHPQFIEKSWRLPSRCPNTSPVLAGAPGGRGTAFNRLMNKPFTISEYNYSGPGRYRGVGGILTGCMAALQDWSVVWRFAYSHRRENVLKPSTAGYFDMATDPLNQAAERASMCLFLRGDLDPAPRSAAITLNPETLEKGDSHQGRTPPSWDELVPVIQVGTFLGDRQSKVPADIALPTTDAAPAAADVVMPKPYDSGKGSAILKELRAKGWLDAANKTDLDRKRGQSASDQFLMDGEKDMMVLDTPRTAGGYAEAGQTIHTQAADFSILDTGATVWISSLDKQPITSSKRLLLTHLTDLQNTEVRYAERGRKTLLAWGKLPHLVRVGEAKISLHRSGAKLPKVYVLATSGHRLGEVPVTKGKNGTLELAISTKGEAGAQLMYELDFR
nr:glycosyl hydrolase family 5 [uncultured bacterium]